MFILKFRKTQHACLLRMLKILELLSFIRFFFLRKSRRVWLCRAAQHCSDQFYHQTADRAREGVSLQQVFDARQACRNSCCPPAEWDSGEDLVSESSHETEEARKRGSAAKNWVGTRGRPRKGWSFIRAFFLCTVHAISRLLCDWSLLLGLMG